MEQPSLRTVSALTDINLFLFYVTHSLNVESQTYHVATPVISCWGFIAMYFIFLFLVMSMSMVLDCMAYIRGS